MGSRNLARTTSVNFDKLAIATSLYVGDSFKSGIAHSGCRYSINTGYTLAKIERSNSGEYLFYFKGISGNMFPALKRPYYCGYLATRSCTSSCSISIPNYSSPILLDHRTIVEIVSSTDYRISNRSVTWVTRKSTSSRPSNRFIIRGAIYVEENFVNSVSRSWYSSSLIAQKSRIRATSCPYATQQALALHINDNFTTNANPSTIGWLHDFNRNTWWCSLCENIARSKGQSQSNQKANSTKIQHHRPP